MIGVVEKKNLNLDLLKDRFRNLVIELKENDGRMFIPAGSVLKETTTEHSDLDVWMVVNSGKGLRKLVYKCFVDDNNWNTKLFVEELPKIKFIKYKNAEYNKRTREDGVDIEYVFGLENATFEKNFRIVNAVEACLKLDKVPGVRGFIQYVKNRCRKSGIEKLSSCYLETLCCLVYQGQYLEDANLVFQQLSRHLELSIPLYTLDDKYDDMCVRFNEMPPEKQQILLKQLNVTLVYDEDLDVFTTSFFLK
jgi:hypothetical protein